MREQRLRWFRSLFHISSRSRQIIMEPRGSLRGKAVLPYMLINSARRAMMIPLLIFATAEYLIGTGEVGILHWQPIAAAMAGASIMLTTIACLVNGMPRALLGLPEYLLFRILRSYFTLESMLTIRVAAERVPFEFNRG